MREAFSKSEVGQFSDEIRRAARDEYVLIFEVAMNVALLMGERQGIECLGNNRDAFRVSEITPVHFRQSRSVGAFDELRHEIDDTIMRAARSEERRVGKECRSRWAPD